MTRWRRPLILIALLLLAGAVVNVAVAWVLAGAPDSWTPGGPRHGEPASDEDRLAILKRLNAPLGLTERAHVGQAVGLGWTIAAVASDDEDGPVVVIGVAAGWPARALQFTQSMHTGDSNWKYSRSLVPPRKWLPGSAWFDRDRDRLPLDPIPAGFAINTLFYTALLAFTLTLTPLRRHLRARRGRCPKCGYDRAGLAGAGSEGAAPCPECGATE